MRRGAGHRGATPGCRPRRQRRAQPHINKDFLINPIVHYRKSYFKFEMPGPFAVMRAARLVFAQSGRQGPRLSGLVAAHTCSPHCPGGARCAGADGPPMLPPHDDSPRRPPDGNKGMPPAARRPVWVSAQPSAGPIAGCSFAYAIFPAILISPCPAVPAARMQPQGGRTMACTAQQAVGNRLPSDWAQSCERLSRL